MLPLAVTISLLTGNWTDCGYVLAPSASCVVWATGLGHTGPLTNNTACNPGGAIPTPFPIIGDGAAYGFYPCSGAGGTVAAQGSYALNMALHDEGAGPPDTWNPAAGFNAGVSPITYGFAPGYQIAYTVTNTSGIAKRLWGIFACTGLYYQDIESGSYTVYVCNSVTIPTLAAQLTTINGQTAVVLTWNDEGALYGIYRDGVLIADSVSATTYTDTTVQGSATYTYTIVLETPCQVSGPSNAVTIMTPASPQLWTPQALPVSSWDESCADALGSGSTAPWTPVSTTTSPWSKC